MLLCELFPPYEPLSNESHGEIEPATVHSDPSWSATEASVVLDAVCVLVPFIALYREILYAFDEFGLLYLYTGCVMLWLSSGVFTAMSFPCPCCGTTWLCSGNWSSVNVTVSEPPVVPSACEFETPITTRPERSGMLNVVSPSPAP